MIKLVNVLIDVKYHQLFIQLLITFLIIILRPAHNSKCHHVIQVLDWPDSDSELSF